jgi:tetratricopeptide (TPR) repeat protein
LELAQLAELAPGLLPWPDSTGSRRFARPSSGLGISHIDLVGQPQAAAASQLPLKTRDIGGAFVGAGTDGRRCAAPAAGAHFFMRGRALFCGVGARNTATGESGEAAAAAAAAAAVSIYRSGSVESSMRHKPLPRSLLAGALVVLAACGADPSAQQLLDAARAHLDKGEPAAAVIELKRALDKEPQSAQARQWLGKALLAKGDVAGAVVELQKARELGLPAERVVLDLARAYLANGQSIQAVLELRGMKLADPKEQAELLTLQAAALTAQRQPGEARALLDEALLLTPDYAPAVVARAQLDAADGRLDEALTKVDALWTRDKTLAAAGLLKAAATPPPRWKPTDRSRRPTRARSPPATASRSCWCNWARSTRPGPSWPRCRSWPRSARRR